jgi:Domain of unknown function (DUF2017)
MASVRRRSGGVRVSLETEEAALLSDLVEQVLALLGDGHHDPPTGAVATDLPDAADAPDAPGADDIEALIASVSEPVATPRDAALLRLLPDGYREDDEAAAEFRRLTEATLRATKRAALQRVADDLSDAGGSSSRSGVRLDLDEVAVAAWLPALTDVRLTFGTRIGVSEDMDDERADAAVGSERFAELAVYDWMSWLQDAMVRALMGD